MILNISTEVSKTNIYHQSKLKFFTITIKISAADRRDVCQNVMQGIERRSGPLFICKMPSVQINTTPEGKYQRREMTLDFLADQMHN